MSLWRRTPREVYRVYGEDQYREAEMSPEEETVAREGATTAEPNSRAGASRVAFAAETPLVSPDTAGSSSAGPSGFHAGRLVGGGLLVGVGLATLALVFLNMSHRHGAMPKPVGQAKPVGQGIRVEDEHAVERATGAGRAQPIAHSVHSKQAQAPRFSAPPVRTPMRASESKLQRRAPVGGRRDTAPRRERAWLAALRASGEEAPLMVADEPPAQVAVEPPVQDEFGFEQ